MNKNLLLILILFFSVEVVANDLPDDVLKSIGKVISYEDKAERYQEIGRDPYSAEHHMRLIETEFDHIQSKHPISIQVDFMWVIMSRSGFGSHYSERFTELLYKCCNTEFNLALQQYLEAGTKVNSTTEHKVKFIKAALNNIQEHHNKTIKDRP